MIPILNNEFDILLGKLGSWPSDVDSATCRAIFDTACSSLSAGGLAIDTHPNGGKSTVILAAAAHRAGSKVLALDDWTPPAPAFGGMSQRGAEMLWFSRAMRLFNLDKMVSMGTTLQEASNVQFILWRGEEADARALYMEELQPGGVIFGLGINELSGSQPEASGSGWKAWRKVKTDAIQADTSDKAG